MRDENATPGPKCKEYARVFNAMTTLDPILEAYGGLHPPSFQTDIGPLSKIPFDFKALQLLLLRLLCSICLSLPGILSSSWSYSSQAADASDAVTGAGHRCLFHPVFCGKKVKSDKFRHPI